MDALTWFHLFHWFPAKGLHPAKWERNDGRALATVQGDGACGWWEDRYPEGNSKKGKNDCSKKSAEITFCVALAHTALNWHWETIIEFSLSFLVSLDYEFLVILRIKLLMLNI